MDQPHVYEIRVEGHLSDRWSAWFEGLAIRNDPTGETTLSGQISDQAALFGLLNKIYALNLRLISVNRDGFNTWQNSPSARPGWGISPMTGIM